MNGKQFRKIIENEETAIRYLLEVGVIHEHIKCYKCKHDMHVCVKKKLYRCNRVKCKRSTSLFKGTFFATCKFGVDIVLNMVYLYQLGMPIRGIITDTGLSSATVTEWLCFYRELVMATLDEEDTTIGGDGIIVEIDETKLGRRKYNRGHHVDGVWCVGGIERTEAKKCFYTPVINRNAETLREVIERFVRPGSIVYTDCWKAYKGTLQDLGYVHGTVNHSEAFKDPITGIHTNTIEGLNNGLKMSIMPRNRTATSAEEQIGFFLWKRKHKGDLWAGFISALKDITY